MSLLEKLGRRVVQLSRASCPVQRDSEEEEEGGDSEEEDSVPDMKLYMS